MVHLYIDGLYCYLQSIKLFYLCTYLLIHTHNVLLLDFHAVSITVLDCCGFYFILLYTFIVIKRDYHFLVIDEWSSRGDLRIILFSCLVLNAKFIKCPFNSAIPFWGHPIINLLNVSIYFNQFTETTRTW